MLATAISDKSAVMYQGLPENSVCRSNSTKFIRVK